MNIQWLTKSKSCTDTKHSDTDVVNHDKNYLDGSKFDSQGISDRGGDETGEGDGSIAGVEDEQVHRARTRVGGYEAKIQHFLRGEGSV